MFGNISRFFRRYFADPPFAATGRGRMRGWRVSSAGPNTAIVSSAAELRRKARDLTRHYPYMNSAYATLAANIVGPGIRVLPATGDEKLDHTLKTLWNEWTDECDVTGVNDLVSLLSLMVRERYEGGECFLRFLPVSDADLRVPLRLQLLPAEQCDLDFTVVKKATAPRVVAGIRFDATGKRTGYVMFREHPAESLGVVDSTARVILPASEVCHYFEPLWATQVRGIPAAFAGLLKAREMLEYDEAELAKKKLAAMMAGFITSPAPDGILNADPLDPDASLGEAVAEITPGSLTQLNPGEDIKFNSPAESGSSYEPYMAHSLRALAASVGLTYEEFTNDMSKTNFSSSRMGLNITQRKHRQEQNRLVHQVLRPIWHRFVDAAVLSGAVSVDAALYAASPARFRAARFQPAGWAYVNPVQEIAAQKEKVLSGLASRSQIISEMGYDAAEVDAAIAADAERAEKLGLVFAVDPTNGRGAPPPATSGEA